jgi:16S rRNA (adenine1518-N6/adenine1519-N6)-dimethyltransferase
MNTRELMQRYQVRPKQSLAQNFLTDPVHLARIVEAAELTTADTVLEVGPGLGSLTHLLADQAGRVIAVELDNRLIDLLRKEFANQPHVQIIHGDILEVEPGGLVGSRELGVRNEELEPPPPTPTPPLSHSPTPYKVVANLPYYITSAVLRHLLEAEVRPTRIVVLVQKEVAERICTQPGDLSLLAVSVQYYAQPTLVHHVPASAFHPAPKVDSAVLRLDLLPTPAVPGIPAKAFFRVVRAGFSQKRKQLINTLSGGLHLPKADVGTLLEQNGIDPKRRAETLSLTEWGVVCRAVGRQEDGETRRQGDREIE